MRRFFSRKAPTTEPDVQVETAAVAVPDPAASEIRCAVNCYTCAYQVWRGGDPPPFTDGQEVLTAYADASCPRVDCPHTTAARDAATKRRPDRVLADMQARIAALEAKGQSTGRP